MIDRSGKVYRQTQEALMGGARLIANRGGTRSGKTFSVCALLTDICLTATRKVWAVDIVSESFPHLKRGAMEDLENIISEMGFTEGQEYESNRSDHIFRFQNGSQIRLFSAEDWGKVKGSKRDILFINEANRIPYEVYRQLSVRTTRTILLDWNPDAEFWYELKGLDRKEDTVEIHSTYKDNSHLSEIQIAEIESNKDDENWWRVYGLGLTGHAEGIVYKRWEQVDEIPTYADLVGRGLDFGYTNDPTAIVDVWYADGALWLDELCYSPGLTNDKIAERLRGLPPSTIADSAEQKSIDEIKNYGVRYIEPAIKGRDSVKNGIQILQRYPMKVTSRSTHLIYELRNYKYKEEKTTGIITNEPVDKWNHALDAVRYVALNRLAQRHTPQRPQGRIRQV